MENKDRAEGTAGEAPIGEETPEGARAGLDLLRAGSRATGIEGVLPHTPLWYAAALASVVAGLTMFDREAGTWAWLVGAGVAAAIMTVHYFRTVTVTPRRSKRTVAVNLIVLAVVWALSAGWGALVSSTDQVSVLRVGAAWVATTLVLGALMSAMNRYRERALAL